MNTQTYRTAPPIPSIVQPNNWGIVIPEARTNLVKNPSFELNASTWSAVGTGVSVARDTTTSCFGGACGKMIDTASTGAGEYIQTDAIPVAAGATYTLSYRYKKTCIAAGTGTAGVFIRDGVGTVIAQPTRNLIKGNATNWVYETFTFVVPAGGVDVRIFFATNGVASGVFTLWLDGVQLETGGYATTYIDGDQPGCYWTNQQHASTSSRHEWSRQGGRIMNLSDFKFIVLAVVGASAPAINTVSNPYALGGANYRRSVIQQRDFAIAGQIQAASPVDLRRQKAALFDAIKPDAFSPQQPVRLAYQMRDNNDMSLSDYAFVDAVYTGGIEGNETGLTSEAVSLTFRVHAPWIAVAPTDQSIALSNYSTFTRVARKDKSTGEWLDMAHPSATGGGVFVTGLAEDVLRRYVYAIDGANVRRWDGTSWTTIGTVSGGGAVIWDVKVGPDANLYICGDFTTVSGTAATRIAKYDGSSWSALGAGLGEEANVMAFTLNGTLIAGTAKKLQRWTGAAWTNIVDHTSGVFVSLGGDIYDIAVATNGDIWVSSDLKSLGGLETGQLYKVPYDQQLAGTWGWEPSDPTLWITGGRPTELEATPWGTVLVGGNFTTVGGLSIPALFEVSSNGAISYSVGGVIALSEAVIDGMHVSKSGKIYLALEPVDATVFYNNRNLGSTTLVSSSPTSTWQSEGVSVYTWSSSKNTYAVLESTYGLIVGSLDYQQYPYTAVVNTASSGRTPLQFRITGPGTLFGLYNYTTKASIRFQNLTLQSGEVVTIQTGPSPYVVSNMRGDLTISYMEAESNLYTFALINGTNRIGAKYESSSGNISAWYRPRFDTIDQVAR